MHTFDLSTQEAKAERSLSFEFEVSLVYRASKCQVARATPRNPVSKNKPDKQKSQKETKKSVKVFKED